MFDKISYWKNRKKGLRGQGVVKSPIVKTYSVEEWAKLSKQEKKQIGRTK